MTARLVDRTVGIGDGIDLHYVEAGAGRPLIIIPSWSLTGAAYRHQLQALSRTRRVMAFDMRGHGDSTTPAGGYRVSRLAADLRAVIERLELDQVDLMGHSIGSSIIWSYIDLFGEDRLGRLVFVDQAPSVTAKPDWSAADRVTYGCLLPDLDALTEFYLQVLAAETAEATVPVIARLFSPSLPAAELLWFAREICKLPRRHAADLLYDHCGLDWRDVIKRVRRPTSGGGRGGEHLLGGVAALDRGADPRCRGRDLQGRRGRLALHVLRESVQIQRTGGGLPLLRHGLSPHVVSRSLATRLMAAVWAPAAGLGGDHRATVAAWLRSVTPACKPGSIVTFVVTFHRTRHGVGVIGSIFSC